MRKINKIINTALIFMILGCWGGQELAYALRPPLQFSDMGREAIKGRRGDPESVDAGADSTVQETTIGVEIARALQGLVFPGVKEPGRRLILAYPGAPIVPLLTEISNAGLLNVIRAAPNEFILTDVAFGLAQLNGIAVIVVTHGVGAKPVLAEVSKFINEGLPLLIFTASNSSNDPTYDGLHALSSPSAKVPNREKDIAIAKALGLDVFRIRFTEEGDASIAPAMQIEKAVKSSKRNKRPVLIVVDPKAPLQLAKFSIQPKNPAISTSTLSEKDIAKYKALARRTVRYLLKKDQPALHVGEGVPTKLATLIEQVSAELGIFLTVTWGAKGLIDESIDTYGGIYQGDVTVLAPGTKKYMENADFVLRLGNRRIPLDLEDGVGTRKFPKDTISIWADNKYPEGEHIEYYLKQLLVLARQQNYKPKNITSIPTFSKEVQPLDISELLSRKVSRRELHLTLTYYNFNIAHLKPLTYLVDPGSTWFPGAYMATKGHQAVFSNWNYGEIGVSAGQAMAVALSTDNLPIVLSGDGGYAQKGAALLPDFKRLGKDVIFVIFDNKTLMMGRPKAIEEKLRWNLYDTGTTDIVSIAKAQGVKARTVNTNQELLDALQNAEKEKGVHVIVVPIENAEEDVSEALKIYANLMKARPRAKLNVVQTTKSCL